MKHHQYTLHRGLDKEVVLEPVDFTWLEYLSWFTFDVKWFKVIMFTNIAHVFGKADNDFFSWDPLFPLGDKKRKKMCNWARLVFIGHHMYAAVPFYNLRKLHKTIASDTPETLKGFLTGIKRIMTIKKQQKQNPGYCFMPTFPSSASPPRISAG